MPGTRHAQTPRWWSCPAAATGPLSTVAVPITSPATKIKYRPTLAPPSPMAEAPNERTYEPNATTGVITPDRIRLSKLPSVAGPDPLASLQVDHRPA